MSPLLRFFRGVRVTPTVGRAPRAVAAVTSCALVAGLLAAGTVGVVPAVAANRDAMATESPEPGAPSGEPSRAAETVTEESPARFAARAEFGIFAAGVAGAPVQVWGETFEASGNAVIRLPGFATGAYTADTYWLDFANCNGVIVNYNTALATGATECTSTSTDNQRNARLNIRRMADVLGQVDAGVVGSASASAPVNGSTETTRSNRAVAEWTSAGTGSTTANRVVDRVRALGVTATTPRYYVPSLDIVEASCTTTTSRSQISLSLAAGTANTTGAPITACTDARASFYTSPLVTGETGWVFGGASVRAGRFTSNTSLLVPAAQAANVLPTVRNLNASSGGNDFAIDNLSVLDATPSLDMAFAADTVVAGTPTTLTYTITNTSELASKSDWSFTNALPAGLVVAPSPAVGGTCTNATGTAFAVTAAAGSSSIGAVGGDLTSGATSCTITVDVVAGAAGTYANAPGNVSTFLGAPDAATLVVEAPVTITVQKNVAARAVAADQFRLALTLGGTEVATATTTGSAAGLQAQRIGPANVTRGDTYTISEAVVSTSSLNTYTSSYSCLRDGTTIAIGSSVSGEVTIPDEPGVAIVCTFTNTPQASPTLYCDGTYYYGVRANGSIAQVNATSTAAPTQLVGAVAGAADVNALGINRDGTAAFAVDRGTTPGSAAAVVQYSTTGGTLDATRTALTPVQGAFVDRAGTAVDGTIIAGAIDPLTNRFIVGKTAAGSVRLWQYQPEVTTGSRFLYLGQVATGTTAAENGDFSFDAQGNLHIVQTAADSSTVGMFSVTRASYLTAAGGAIPATATVRRALTGADAANPLTAVNGMAFSPRGTVYLGGATSAYQFDPTTWVRIPGSPRGVIGAAPTGATSTDLAACTSPSTLSLEKNVVGRLNGTDQFRLAVSAGSPLAQSSVATTTGTATGLQAARIGPTPVQIDTAVTISETMAAGSSSPISAYTTVYECWAGGTRIARGTERSATITIPNTLSVGVACTYFNSPLAGVSTVTITKQILDPATGTTQPAPGWTVGLTASPTTGYATAVPNESPRQQTAADGTALWTALYQNAAARATLTFSELQQSGFAFVSATCTVGGATTPVTFTEAGGVISGSLANTQQGQPINCTFVNRPIATLVLRKQVIGGASPNLWTLTAARQVATALVGPTGPGAISGTVSPGVAYRLSESAGPATYTQVGGWSCLTATNQAVPVTGAGDVTVPRGATVTCTITNGTASVTLLKNVQSPSPGFQPATWNLTAIPATFAGLSPVTVAGADFQQGGNDASTFTARPGHSYTLSEALATPGTRLAYRQVRLEQRVGTTWVEVTSPTITAPAAGQSAVYRFVNAPVEPSVLPLTGGASTDAFLIGGGLVLTLALGLAVWHARRRTRGALR